MKKLTILSILFIAVLFSAETKAQELKIGYVDPQTILDRMPEMKAVQQRLLNFTERIGNELRTKEAALNEAIETYRLKESAISESAKQAEQEKIQMQSIELSNAEQQAQQDIAVRRNELLGPLLDQIDDAITEVAKKNGLSYVLNTVTNSGDLIILYASPDFRTKYDITSQVMDYLGM